MVALYTQHARLNCLVRHRCRTAADPDHSVSVARMAVNDLPRPTTVQRAPAFIGSIVTPRPKTPATPRSEDADTQTTVSDNGPQMTSGSTREFMALHAIAVHFGRPGTPTDQAWIETFFGHLKAEFPHLLKITEPAVLRAELDHLQVHWKP